MLRLFLSLLIVLTSSFSVFACDKNIIAFDLDETLIASDALKNSDFAKVEELGYEIKETVNGQKYVLRPGAVEILKYAKSIGFDLMVLTHNTKSYAQDIIESAGIAEYFVDLKANEDMRKSYNTDFTTYPNHRNRVHKNKRSIVETYTKSLYKGLFQRGFLALQGNKNIHYYIPCYNCDKYPPLYGARVLIDNSNYNIENPIDYVGLKVEEFTALKLDALDSQGNYAWVEKLKQDLLYLKRSGWVELYEKKYDKAPDATPVHCIETKPLVKS